MSFPKLSEGAFEQLGGTVLGAELGRGVGRAVYAYELDATKVVKVEDTAQSFQNVVEWEAWRVVKDTHLAKWFAPCHHISPNGSILIQERTTPIVRFPAKVPSFFTDLKLANFGKLPGRPFVSHDYGSILVRLFYLTTRRTVPMLRIRGTDSVGWAKT